MTKTSIFGQNENQNKTVKKPIEFKKFIGSNGEIVSASGGITAGNFDNVCLLSRNYTNDGLDLILAYDQLNQTSGVTLYLGHWNDGVV